MNEDVNDFHGRKDESSNKIQSSFFHLIIAKNNQIISKISRQKISVTLTVS